ncbi:MAG TPA: long-chain fatty acid--CoA ligase [Anaerolineae bacterium]|nr:long-chain fatty acid--CoA ligase [Anaerolineae bacterium]
MDKPWLAHYDKGVPASLKPYPELPLHVFLEQSARKHPDQVAIAFKPSHQGFAKSALSYAQLDDLADRLAAALAGLGVKKGDRVAIFMPNIPQFIIAFYAVLKIGAVVVATNPTYTPREIEHQLNDSGAETIICMSRFYPIVQQTLPKTRLKNVIVTNIKEYMSPILRVLFGLAKEKKSGDRVVLAPGHVWLQDLLAKYTAAQRPRVDVGPDDRAIFQYSGGTTGVPKAAIGLHRNLVANALQIRAWFVDVREGQEITLVAIPLFHVYGMVCGMIFSVQAAASMVLVPNARELETVIDAIDTYRPTIFPGVPRLYNAINNHPGIEKHDLRTIRACISGSAPLLLDIKSKFEAITGGKLVEGYGLSEAPTATHCNPLSGLNKEGSIGLPFPDVECRLVSLDDGVTPVGLGDVGELCLRGPQVMFGYHNMPTETANALRKDPNDPTGAPWLYTGDIARMDDDGYYYIVDRKKELIKAGGYQVWPREIEEVIAMHPAVLEVGAAGIPDAARGGESVKAWVVLKPGMTATEADIKKFISDKLAPYKQPRSIEFRAELPKTLVGKVLRRVLVEEEKKKVAA